MKFFNVHPSDDQLDLYLLDHLDLEERRLIEEHYFCCEDCLDRLSDGANFVAALRTAVQSDPPNRLDGYPATAPPIASGVFVRIAAMLLIGVGTALVCDAPVPLRDRLPRRAAVDAGSAALVKTAQPKASAIRHRVRRSTLVGSSHPLRIFQPPPSRPAPLAMVAIEIPDGLYIPDSSIVSQRFSSIVGQFQSLSLPPFQTKPRWFRRILVAVRKGLERGARL